MKVLFACLLLVSTAHADALQSIEIVEALDTARVERTSGAVMAATGMALALAATAVGIYTATLPDGGCGTNDACISRRDLGETSIGLAAAGSVLMTIGVPLWAVGNEKVRALEKRARISGFVGKSGGGASVRVSF